MDESSVNDACNLPLPHVNAMDTKEQTEVKIKKPKKILHFSDGILEEYSSDEDAVDAKNPEPIIDPKTLTWGPWTMYKIKSGGASVLSAIDYVGGGLAGFFGISSPKYFYEIEEHKRKMKEEKEYNEEITNEMAGWTDPKREHDNKAYVAEEHAMQKIEKY